ncbi:MAG TPA: glycosyltransferase 87 family protein [Candidatus Limnocylindrales bacterium]|nr:glycosyltransferase 87 family protein [Candidatus Limnocylindrales bacterium]
MATARSRPDRTAPLLASHDILERLRRDPRSPWLLPLALAGYVVLVTSSWEFPAWWGVPYPPVFLAATALVTLAWRRFRDALRPIELTVLVVAVSALMTDVTSAFTQPIRDIELYLKAGERFLAGQPVYLTTLVTTRPEDLSNYPFLYPPVTLPLFGALSLLPLPLAVGAWVGASVAAAVTALRLLGLPWRWTLAALAWPPFFQGLFVGNVAIPMFLLFVLAPRFGAGLVVPPLFKAYAAITTLWLVRERRWLDLAGGAALVGLAVLGSLLVVEPRLWLDWLRGLELYRASQAHLPALYGLGLGQYVPLVVVPLAALVFVVAAVVGPSPTERLARLGVATVVGSPSLFSHGFTLALPAILGLRTSWLWLALGITSAAPGLAWWVVPVVVLASWALPALRSEATRPWPQWEAGTRARPTVLEEASRAG